MSVTHIIPKGDARTMTIDVIQRRIAALPPTRAWAIEVKEWRERKTDAQQGYLWGVVYRTIADYCGCTTKDVHRDLGRLFLFDGEQHGIARVRSTANFSVKEMGEYIDLVIAWAATELGVVIPEPIQPAVRAA